MIFPLGLWRILRSNYIISLPLFCVLIMTACQMKPTKVRESSGNTIRAVEAVDPKSEVVITPETVVLDVREPFAFATSHIVGARWIDIAVFRDDRSRFIGAIPSELGDVTRRLSRMGIRPETPVVVIGNGQNGNSAEGRLAWFLKYVGVNKVQFATQDYFNARVTSQVSPTLESVVWWDAKPLSKQIVEPDEIKKISTQRSSDTYLLDVRPDWDYLGKEGFGKARRVPNIGSMNVPWTEFITAYGRPEVKIMERFAELGITTKSRLVVLSSQGIESGLVVHVLNELGYQNVSHVPGGLEQILSVWSKK